MAAPSVSATPTAAFVWGYWVHTNLRPGTLFGIQWSQPPKRRALSFLETDPTPAGGGPVSQQSFASQPQLFQATRTPSTPGVGGFLGLPPKMGAERLFFFSGAKCHFFRHHLSQGFRCQRRRSSRAALPTLIGWMVCGGRTRYDCCKISG